MASRGVLGLARCGGSPGPGGGPGRDQTREGSQRGEEERTAACPWGIERSVPKDEWRTEGRPGGGQGSPCQSLHCVHLPPPSPSLSLSVSFSSPSSVSPSAPGVCVADKRERRRRGRTEEGGGGGWSRHDAVCLGRLPRRGQGTGQRASAVELPSSHSSPSLPLSPPTSTAAAASPAPSRRPFFFMGDETAGLLGQAGLGIRIRLARVGWQMAA